MFKHSHKRMTQVKSVPTGKMFVNGISSSYEEAYSSELEPVLSREEHYDIVNRLNTTLAAYWPCGLVYVTGYVLVPCTVGLSLLCPMMCVTDAEKHAIRLLENLSLKAKYYDRGVSFKLEKQCMTSRFVISFPAEEESSSNPLSLGRSLRDEELGDSRGNGNNISYTNISVMQGQGQGEIAVAGIREEPGGDRDRDRVRLKYT